MVGGALAAHQAFAVAGTVGALVSSAVVLGRLGFGGWHPHEELANSTMERAVSVESWIRPTQG